MYDNDNDNKQKKLLRIKVVVVGDWRSPILISRLLLHVLGPYTCVYIFVM